MLVKRIEGLHEKRKHLFFAAHHSGHPLLGQAVGPGSAGRGLQVVVVRVAFLSVVGRGFAELGELIGVESHAEGFFRDGRVARDPQHLRAFLHDVRGEEEHSVAAVAFKKAAGGTEKFILDGVDHGGVHEFDLAYAYLAAVDLEFLVVALENIVGGVVQVGLGAEHFHAQLHDVVDAGNISKYVVTKIANDEITIATLYHIILAE